VALSIVETVLVFIGIPLVVVLVLAGLVLGGATRRSKRYRPGRPFQFTPVWFLSAPSTQQGGAPEKRPGRELGGAERLALSKEVSGPAEERSGASDLQHVTGGASDRW
jgi:hypothetical protein